MRKNFLILIIIFGVTSFFSYLYLGDKAQKNIRKMEIESTKNKAVSLQYINDSDIAPLVDFAKEKRLNLFRIIQTEEETKYFSYISYVKPQFYLKGSCEEYINLYKIDTDKKNRCYTEDILANDKIEFLPIQDINKLVDYNYKGNYLLTDEEGSISFKTELEKTNMGSVGETIVMIDILGFGDVIIFTSLFLVIILLVFLQYVFLSLKEYKKRAIYKINSNLFKTYRYFAGNFIALVIVVNLLVFWGCERFLWGGILDYVRVIIVTISTVMIFMISLINIYFDRKINNEITAALKNSSNVEKVSLFMKILATGLVAACTVATTYLFIPLQDVNLRYNRIMSIQETSKYGKIYENQNRIPPGNYFEEQAEIFKKKNFFEREGAFYIDTSELDMYRIKKEKGCFPGMPKQECEMPVHFEVDDAYVRKYAPNIKTKLEGLYGNLDSLENIIIIAPKETKTENIENIKFRYSQPDYLRKNFDFVPGTESGKIIAPGVQEYYYETETDFFTFREENDFFDKNSILVLKPDKIFYNLSGGIENFYIKKYDENKNDITQEYWNSQEIDPGIFSANGAFNYIQGNLDIYNQEISVMKDLIKFLVVQIFIILLMLIFVIWQYIELDLSANRRKRIIQKINGYNWRQINKKTLSQTGIILFLNNIAVALFLSAIKQNVAVDINEYYGLGIILSGIFASLFFCFSYVAIEINERKNMIKTLKGGEL